MNRRSSNVTEEQAAISQQMYEQLKRHKPSGWSVVFGDGEVVVRPVHRKLGKFSVRLSNSDEWYVAFFSQDARAWVQSTYFPLSVPGAEILSWIVSQMENDSHVG